MKKGQQTKPKVSRRKEIIKSRAKINEIESKKKYKRSTNPIAGSWKDKQDWQTFNQTHQEKRQRTQIKSEMKERQRIVRKAYEQLYANNWTTEESL